MNTCDSVKGDARCTRNKKQETRNTAKTVREDVHCNGDLWCKIPEIHHPCVCVCPSFWRLASGFWLLEILEGQIPGVEIEQMSAFHATRQRPRPRLRPRPRSKLSKHHNSILSAIPLSHNTQSPQLLLRLTPSHILIRVAFAFLTCGMAHKYLR